MTTATAPKPTDLLAEPSWFRRLPPGRDLHRLDEGIYAVTGNAAVREALSHPRILAEHPLKASARAFGPNVLDADGPEHKAFRALLGPALSAARIDQYKSELMPGLIEDLLDRVADVETADFYDLYAHKIPYGIVCTILGVDLALEDRLRALTRPLARLLDYPTLENQETHANVAELLHIIEQQRAAHTGTGSSLLETIEAIRARKGINLTDGEIRSTALLFFIAGTETSSAFITSLVYCLGRLMFSMDEFRDAGLREAFIEEVLRLFPPVQTAVRFATDDVEIAGERIPRHAALIVSIAAANRDPRVFAYPDRFDVTRSHKQSVPFAAGAHACPGFALAKAEFSLLIERMIDRVASIAVTRDSRRMDSQSFSHPTGFTVQFTHKPRRDAR